MAAARYERAPLRPRADRDVHRPEAGARDADGSTAGVRRRGGPQHAHGGSGGRKRLAEITDGEHELMPGLLPEGRAAKPTGRNVLAAFQALGLTHTADGIVLDRLTATQREILQLLAVEVPWPEQER